MINAPYEKEFVFQDGRRAKNLLELQDVLETLGKEDFKNCANEEKNDFASWIEYVLMDSELAGRLRSTYDMAKTKELVSQRISKTSQEEDSISRQARFSLGAFRKKGQREQPQAMAHAILEPAAKEIFHPEKNILEKGIRQDLKQEQRHHGLKWHWLKKHEKIQENSPSSQPSKEGYSENIIWMILYGLLVGIIIIIVIY